MSNGNGTIDSSLLPGITDEEAKQLGQMFESQTAECEAPKLQLALPLEAVEELYKYTCGILRKLGSPEWGGAPGGGGCCWCTPRTKRYRVSSPGCVGTRALGPV